MVGCWACLQSLCFDLDHPCHQHWWYSQISRAWGQGRTGQAEQSPAASSGLTHAEDLTDMSSLKYAKAGLPPIFIRRQGRS